MPLIVQKYGGSSVGSPERINKVADRIARARAEGYDIAVVVSAMGHTTDELIDLAHRVAKNPPNREMDMLLSAGERISMALLCMALSDRKVPALSFTGSQSGIITDSSHRRARIKRILGDRVRSALGEGKVAIVAGFQGVSESKEITTLGRGGSDTTAVALAAVLKADRCEIYTDVDGVFSADPRVVPNVRLLPRISHAVMVELATRGAGVLHPRSVELAKQFQVDLRVCNSLSEDDAGLNQKVGPTSRGTRIMTVGMEDFSVVGVTADHGKMLIRVSLMRPTVLGAVFDRAAETHLPIVAPCFAEGELRFFSDTDGEGEWRKLLDELACDEFVKGYELFKNLIPLSVVGDRFSQDGAALQKVIEILARNQISVTMGTASALAITVAVSASHADDGVRALHEEFLEVRKHD